MLNSEVNIEFRCMVSLDGWRFTEWRFTEWRFTEWRFTEWRHARWPHGQDKAGM